jgi:hypothetical protein
MVSASSLDAYSTSCGVRLPCSPSASPARQRTPATDGTRSSAATASDRKALGARLDLQQLRQHVQPLLHRQADGEQIPREEHVEAAAAARIPRQRDQQHAAGGEEDGGGERLRGTGVPARS